LRIGGTTFKFFFRFDDDRVFFGIAIFLFSIKVLEKCFQVLSRLDGVSFFNPALVIPLAIVLLVYGALFILTYHWSRILRIPASFLFLIHPFAFYLLLLINSLIFHLPDQIVLLAALSFLALGAGALGRGLEMKKDEENRQWKGWQIFLITIFIIHGILLFLVQNFRIDRSPFADEYTFWYSAAKVMIEQGFLAAHQHGYPGGGLHPLGVPFLNAFPAMVTMFSSSMIPFFMPLYILIGLFLFLREFVVDHRSKWGVILFLVAWFAVLNNFSWPGELFYSRVYGESVSMVLVLSLLVWFFANEQKLNCRCWEIAAFLLGLLALTKFPLILLAVPFFMVFLTRAWEQMKSVKKLCVMIILFLFPFVILKIFQSNYGGQISSMGGNWGIIFQRFGAPNFDMLKRVVDNISVDADKLWYYSAVTAGFSVFTYKRWKYAWPVFLWILFLIIHYGYYYSYGSVGGGDQASGLRYFLPAAAGLFFLGSYGFANVIGFLDKRMHRFLRPIVYLACLGVIFCNFF